MTDLGYFRVAAAVPAVNVADVNFNIKAIADMCGDLDNQGVQLAVFPELCVTGYTCGDLFHQQMLIDSARRGVEHLCQLTSTMGLCILVGAPWRHGDAIYNCAIAIGRGRILAVVPKTYLPNYNEFYEKRWFAAANAHGPMSNSVLLDIDGVTVGMEICEDLWTPTPPSTSQAVAGAQVMVNLSASNDLIGKRDYLLGLIRHQSAACVGAYVYASAGFGESTTDLVFDGKAVIAENGSLLAINERWLQRPNYVIADIDIAAITHDRLHIMSREDSRRNAQATTGDYQVVAYSTGRTTHSNRSGLRRTIHPHPFVPADSAIVDSRSEEIINIQSSGLARRLAATNTRSLVVGISGGLDSTLALLIAVKTFDMLGLDRKGIVGVTMPGFGTTSRTHSNAVALMEALGVSMREISIVPAVTQHFADIGHDINNHDVTYENSQARERTQLLMDIANQNGGMVLGTGDLSELALGWATYNGDHMSMYGVNAGIPKTLVRHLVSRWANNIAKTHVRDILLDIIDTPISPELIPAASDGTIKQKTENLVGPYELHDFFLYYTLRYGFTPRRIFFMAQSAFAETYDESTIRHWLKIFFRRFFNQQFKRSCMPDGPKVGSVCLSPRGDWRMPSDASAALWLAECDSL